MRVNCRRLKDESIELVVFTTETCTSSMDLAWRLTAEQRFPVWASVLSAAQTSGRGQFGRTWHSPPGNLYGTLRIPRLEPVWSQLLPLLLAESMRIVLKGFGLATAIKWPNDLLVGGKKVGGMLLEARSEHVIAGVGLNLVSAPQPHELRHRLAPPAGCLQEFGTELTPWELWIPFIFETRSMIQRHVGHIDPQKFVRSLSVNLAYIGERVLIDAYEAADQPVVLLGLDSLGAIRVLTPEGERAFRSGSIYPTM
jgi:BirA family biotin operon repressor/biotin-[acetyl-CoA-carboxylase] ligase